MLSIVTELAKIRLEKRLANLNLQVTWINDDQRWSDPEADCTAPGCSFVDGVVRIDGRSYCIEHAEREVSMREDQKSTHERVLRFLNNATAKCCGHGDCTDCV